MFKKRTLSVVVLIFFLVSFVDSAVAITSQEAIDLVKLTSTGLAKDAAGTIEKIINGEHPYKNKDNKAFYVFVYDTDVVIVAHPKKNLVGRNYKGKPDVRGKKFRDAIVQGALDKKNGWVDYSYQKPGEKGIHKKTTYFNLSVGSDGKKYVVCCGKYLKKK